MQLTASTGELGAAEFEEVLAAALRTVDDADPNALGARACGLRVLHHTSPRCTRAALAAPVPAPSPNPQGVFT